MKVIEIPPCTHCTNNNDLFQCLNRTDLEDFSSSKRGNVFKKGQNIFYEGNHSHGLYCIYSGKVKLTKWGSENREQIIRFAGKGEVLGYKALLSDSPYNATATAIEDCQVCHISKSVFLSKLNENKKLAFSTIQLMAGNLRTIEDTLITVSQSQVKERVARALLLLKAKFGLEEDNVTLSVTLSRREIGELASTTIETAIRTLSQLKKDQVIAFDRKKIKIIDMERLFSIAKLDY
ncbi:Crp/Fnr family transcriptional regulator [Fulvivirga sp. M361]|uniref:Crp/Fnr family transcriptional regulator n=1 Tax=Fulvivirga sp. M361 TaxID=2594266 RepID=UPI00117AC6F3|nr:Crp/Fnr family transcriptional regulator [Fulvivirga sp. M361]TRX59420.1 Crp/Fnr family transcriptional regulator [Fulvivirga sp. M361]